MKLVLLPCLVVALVPRAAAFFLHRKCVCQQGWNVIFRTHCFPWFWDHDESCDALCSSGTLCAADNEYCAQLSCWWGSPCYKCDTCGPGEEPESSTGPCVEQCTSPATCFDLENSTDCFTTFAAGGTKRVNLGDGPALQPVNVTVEVWALNMTSSGGYIVSKGAMDCAGSSSYFLYLTSGHLDFGVTTADGWSPFARLSNAVSLFEDGLWYHIVGTYDGTYVKLYVNSILEDTESNDGAIQYSSMTYTNLVIGEYTNPTCNPVALTAIISRVCIWTTALNQSEISDLFGSYVLPSSSDLCPELPCA